MTNYNFWDMKGKEYVTIGMSEKLKKSFVKENPHLTEVKPEKPTPKKAPKKTRKKKSK